VTALSHNELAEDIEMIDTPDDELPKQQNQDRRKRCPTCAAFPRLAHSMLNSRNGRTVRLYQFDCGERIWDD
jgi:hypothetical protein